MDSAQSLSEKERGCVKDQPPRVIGAEIWVSRFRSPASELAFPVRFVPSSLKVKVYFCRPICESNSAFHAPVTSAAKIGIGS